MKIKSTIPYFLFLVAATALGVMVTPFRGWRNLTQSSTDIIVARCSSTPDPSRPDKNGVTEEIVDGVVDSEMNLISVLKGATNSGLVRVTSQYWPRQDECYLIFATHYAGYYQAIEPYHIVPLGLGFSTNILANKTLEEKIQTLLDYRLANLNKQIKQEAEEKQRLEQGLQK